MIVGKPHSRLSPLAAAAILFTLIIAAYSNSLGAGFVLDAANILVADPRQNQVDAGMLLKAFTEHYWWPYDHLDLYRPLTTFSYQLNRLIFGPGAFSYHVVNLLLHFCNAMLIHRIALRLMSPLIALLAAAIFAVHPLTTEAVTNLVGRADLLATLAMLIALEAHIRFCQGRGTRWLIVVGAMGLLAVFCKEHAIMLAGILTGWSLCIGSDSKAKSGWWSIAALAPSWAAMGLARWMVLGAEPNYAQYGADNPLALASPAARFLTALSVQGRYIGLFFWPERLSSDYSFDRIRMVGESYESAAWLAVFIAAAIGVIRLGRRNRIIFFFALAAAAVMLPTSNLLMPIGTIMAERFMYLPVACLAGISLLAYQLLLSAEFQLQRRRPLITASVVVIAALGLRTFQRNRDWHDEQSIWTSARQSAPESFKTWQGSASATMTTLGLEKGAGEMIEYLDNSRRIIESGRLPLLHRPVLTYINLAQALGQLSDQAAGDESRSLLERALALCRKAGEIEAAVNAAARGKQRDLGIHPGGIRSIGYYQLHTLFAALLERSGDRSQAIDQIDIARRLAPGLSYCHLTASDLLDRRGDLELAAVRAWQALLTGDRENARRRLHLIYARLAPGAQVTMQHPPASGHLDQALRDLVELCVHARQLPLAADILAIGRDELHRPVADLLPLLK